MKFTFKHMLLKRAYTEEQMKALAASSDFKSCEIVKIAVGMEIRLSRQPLDGAGILNAGRYRRGTANLPIGCSRFFPVRVFTTE